MPKGIPTQTVLFLDVFGRKGLLESKSGWVCWLSAHMNDTKKHTDEVLWAFSIFTEECLWRSVNSFLLWWLCMWKSLSGCFTWPAISWWYFQRLTFLLISFKTLGKTEKTNIQNWRFEYIPSIFLLAGLQINLAAVHCNHCNQWTEQNISLVFNTIKTWWFRQRP